MKQTRLTLAVLVLLFASAWGMPNGTKSILLQVNPAPPTAVDSKLNEILITDLTRKEDVRVLDAASRGDREPLFPRNSLNLDSLVNWGQEIGGNYLMLVNVTGERIERRKSFSLPLIFHKYETVGIIEGEFRFVDLRHGKLLAAEPFKIEERGAQILQASMDNDINDPDLHLTAVRKLEFMKQLETKLSERLTRRALSLMSGW